MYKSLSLIAFLALVCVTFSAQVQEDVALENEAVKGYRHKPAPKPLPRCHCQCYTGKKAALAYKACHLSYWSHCQVSDCKVEKRPHGYYGKWPIKGKWCCDKKPTPHTRHPTTKYPPTKKTTTTTTTTTTTKKSCPCKCTKKHVANDQCYYKPHCHVTVCHHAHHGYGYHKKYQCCHKH